MHNFLSRHLWARIAVPLFWIIFLISEQNTGRKIGGLRFYGSKEFVESCLKAVLEELPKYDKALLKHFMDGKVHLTFIFDEKYYICAPTAGVFTIAKPLWEHGTEAICQYIVFAYFYSKYTGTGLRTALKDYSDVENVRKTPNLHMVSWLLEKRFPTHWSQYYQNA
jgi:hypothetical protein